MIDEAEKIKTIVENKDYIVQLVNIVAKNTIEVFENLKIEDVNMFQLVYNKAIDTFSNELKELFNRETPSNIDENTAYFALDDVRMWIDVIAEQLKEGGENG